MKETACELRKEGYSYSNIAVILDISLGKVKSRTQHLPIPLKHKKGPMQEAETKRKERLAERKKRLDEGKRPIKITREKKKPTKKVKKKKPTKEQIKERTKEYNQNRRKWAIAVLGGKCKKCGYKKNIHALQVDHIHRNLSKESGSAAYTKIINGETDGYQCLCANCNWIKRMENGEGKHIKEN